MFGPLIQAFRQAIINFRTELHRDDVPGAIAPEVGAMASAVARAAAHCEALKAQARAASLEAESEHREADTCARRLELALEIGDKETARVASEYRDRHLRRRDLLTEKAKLLDREASERAQEVEEMRVGLGEALRARHSG